VFVFFFSSRRRHTRSKRDWSSDVCSSDLVKDCAKTSLVRAPCGMYSWMPKLWIARPRCSATAMPTGEMSVGPCIPDLIWYWAARSEERRVGKEGGERGEEGRGRIDEIRRA